MCGLFLDTVNHGILLSRFFLYGICGPPHSCFERYLTYRTQYVKTECIKFGYENIACGIPQGSTLLLRYVMIYQIVLTNSQCRTLLMILIFFFFFYWWCSIEGTRLPRMWPGLDSRLGVICGLSLLVHRFAPHVKKKKNNNNNNRLDLR